MPQFLIDNRRVEILKGLEPLLNLLPRKRLVANELRPGIVVVTRADGVAAKVDCAGPAEHFAAAVVDLAPVAVFLRDCLVPVVERGLLECYPALPVDAQVHLVALDAGLEEEDAWGRGGLREGVCQGGARGAAYTVCKSCFRFFFSYRVEGHGEG
jgi:hypothetical protein